MVKVKVFFVGLVGKIIENGRCVVWFCLGVVFWVGWNEGFIDYKFNLIGKFIIVVSFYIIEDV